MPVTVDFSSSAQVVPSAAELAQQDKSDIQKARDGLFVDTAVEIWLSYLGQNWNIERPKLSPFDDEMYRRIIQAIALLPKTVLSTLYFLLEAVFGSQASIVAGGGRAWQVYEVYPNEIIIEIPLALISASNENASYLHGFSGVVLSGATTTVFSSRGDATKAAVTLVGLQASALIAGAYVARTISGASYNATIDQTQVTVAALPSPPDPGAPFFINVPGNLVSSYRGDYLAQTAYEKSVATSVATNTLTDTTRAMGSGAYVGYFLRFESGLFYKITANTATVFTLAASGATPPLATYAVYKFITDAQEHADGSDTPSHVDRVYLTGDGKFEIIRQYMTKLVRASGVVLRLEKV